MKSIHIQPYSHALTSLLISGISYPSERLASEQDSTSDQCSSRWTEPSSATTLTTSSMATTGQWMLQWTPSLWLISTLESLTSTLAEASDIPSVPIIYIIEPTLER